LREARSVPKAPHASSKIAGSGNSRRCAGFRVALASRQSSGSSRTPAPLDHPRTGMKIRHIWTNRL
jgi:hypothetical protein